MARGLTSRWGISARSAFVAASVVFVVLAIAGAGLAAVLYRTMLSGVDSAAAGRMSDVADAVQVAGPAGVEPALLQTDQRVVAVQVIRADGTVVRRSASAPDVPLHSARRGQRRAAHRNARADFAIRPDQVQRAQR